MVALERVKVYSELTPEPPEFIEPRPPKEWPSKGEVRCENLVIRYAASVFVLLHRNNKLPQSDLPNVLHNLTFSIRPGEKVCMSSLVASITYRPQGWHYWKDWFGQIDPCAVILSFRGSHGRTDTHRRC